MYRPPMTDSDDSDYDGFSFNSPRVNHHKDRFKNNNNLYPVETLLKSLGEKIVANDFEGYLKEFTSSEHKSKVDVNEELTNGSWCLLYQACFNGASAIVDYMIKEQGAKVNQQKMSLTPLMNTCNSDSDSQEVLKIVKLLCVEGCVVNVSDTYGMTALMYACYKGHTDVVKFLLKMNVALEALDNNACNALHFAVEHNRVEIVKLLIEAQNNSLTDVINKNGHTAKQLAVLSCNEEIISLFPFEEKKYEAPLSFTSYNKFRDLAPGVFEKSEIPAHFPEIVTMLNGMNSSLLINFFAKAEISLEEFLLINDQRMQDIGVIFPFQRKNILLGLLLFHSQKWKKESLELFHFEDQKDYLDMFYLFANLLKHLMILQCSCRYLINLKKEIAGKTDDRLDKSEKLAKYLQQFKIKLEEVKLDLIEVMTMNPKTDHLKLKSNIVAKKPAKNGLGKKLVILGTLLATPLLSFYFYRLLKR